MISLSFNILLLFCFLSVSTTDSAIQSLNVLKAIASGDELNEMLHERMNQVFPILNNLSLSDIADCYDPNFENVTIHIFNMTIGDVIFEYFVSRPPLESLLNSHP